MPMNKEKILQDHPQSFKRQVREGGRPQLLSEAKEGVEEGVGAEGVGLHYIPLGKMGGIPQLDDQVHTRGAIKHLYSE